MSYTAADFMGEVCTVAAEVGAPIPDDADWGSDETAAAAAAVCAALRAARLASELLAALRAVVLAADDLTDGQLSADCESERAFIAAHESARAAIARATEGDFWTEYTSA